MREKRKPYQFIGHTSKGNPISKGPVLYLTDKEADIISLYSSYTVVLTSLDSPKLLKESK
jgi:hypothetical protein